MQINLLEYLENTAALYPEKTAFQDETRSLTFAEVIRAAKAVGSFLCAKTAHRRPVVILSGKSALTPALYLGALYSGCFYVPIGTDLPVYRINLILNTVRAAVILADEQSAALARSLDFAGTVVLADEAATAPIDQAALDHRRSLTLDTDPAYVIFTSGSTGVPKGVVESHRAAIDYIDAFAEAFDITEADTLGNQSPLDYIAAIRDIYLPLKTGARTVLIPKKLFSIPVKLFEYLNENSITVICWVAPALCLCAELKAFEGAKLTTVRKVLFTGSVMPCKYLRVWQENLPNCLFANHYGPTEITASCTYYIVDHTVGDDEILPIGKPFRNTGILLLNEDGTETAAGEKGEICVHGTCLALGYYNNPEKTAEVFVKNPLNTIYHETIYKTGDLGSYDGNGVLRFHGRKDFQIKHMGHRIELSEIESAAKAMDGIGDCCCLYHQDKEQLWLFYTGAAVNDRALAVYLRERLPGYMIPRKLAKMDKLPVNFNGKLDMSALKEMMEA